MALYTISDLHLAFGVEKPMDIFGPEWNNYMQKIKVNWCDNVKKDDYVIIAGDISWATYLEQAHKDFEFINSLPGTKIIIKGNHDYWWETSSKLKFFINQNNFHTINFLQNNSFLYNGTAICGTRGWICPNQDEFTVKDEKIYNRELVRLDLSIQSAIKLGYEDIIVALHYPPVNKKKDMSSGFVKILKEYNVNRCIYGHLHSEGRENALEGLHEGILFNLTSCDHINFTPIKIL